jgi:hypothetical protein
MIVRYKRNLPSVGIAILVNRQADRTQIACALRSAGCLARGLNRGQGQPYQHGDDGDHDKYFDQRERPFAGHLSDNAQQVKTHKRFCEMRVAK